MYDVKSRTPKYTPGCRCMSYGVESLMRENKSKYFGTTTGAAIRKITMAQKRKGELG